MYQTLQLLVVLLLLFHVQHSETQLVECIRNSIRFANGLTDLTEGLIEVCGINNTWLRVCTPVSVASRSFSTLAGRICEILGFSSTSE